MVETWLPVPGYEARYAVSDYGRVVCLRARRLRALVRHTDGYLTVRLTDEKGERRHLVHRLVCHAFNGPPNALHREVSHLDGTKDNNRADNLRWASSTENNTHKRLHGTHQAGELHPRAKLTLEQVRAIRRSSKSSVALGKTLGVHESAIRKIKAGQRWQEPDPAGVTPKGQDQ